jgi:hypothetical protein
MRPLIHFARTTASLVALCVDPNAAALTTDPERVTCPRCLERLAANAGPPRSPRAAREDETIH